MDASLTEAIEQAVSEHMGSAQPAEVAEAPPPKPVPEIEQKPKAKIEIDAERIRTSIGRLTSNSIGELEGLAGELQKLDDFIKYETDRIQRDIDSLLSGIKIIVETISPWKRSATVSNAPLGPARSVITGSRQDQRRA